MVGLGRCRADRKPDQQGAAICISQKGTWPDDTQAHHKKHMDALQHWLEAKREVRNSHKDDSRDEN